MGEGRFTPGPWRVDPDFPADIQVRDGSRDLACTSRSIIRNNPPDQAETWANAHLIAAAPEMYAALSELLEHLDSHCVTEGDCNQARSALAKAESRDA